MALFDFCGQAGLGGRLRKDRVNSLGCKFVACVFPVKLWLE